MGTVTLDSQVALDVVALESAATQAGFELDWVEVEATGTVSSTGEQDALLQLAIPGRSESTLISPAPGAEGTRTFDQLLRLAGTEGVTVWLKGRAETADGGQALIRLDSFLAVEAAGR